MWLAPALGTGNQFKGSEALWAVGVRHAARRHFEELKDGDFRKFREPRMCASTSRSKTVDATVTARGRLPEARQTCLSAAPSSPRDVAFLPGTTHRFPVTRSWCAYGAHMYRPIVAWEDIRNLPLPDLAMKLLGGLAGADGQLNCNSTMRGLDAALRDEPQDDEHALMARVADAWAWLEAHALIGPAPSNTSAGWQRVTEVGRELIDVPGATTKVWAAERLAGELDPALSSARSNFALGDYETAAFAAMKAVEVAVREAAGLPNELLGVNLMRKAFSPKDGVLRDPEAEGGEQQATADLFAGAIGAYKNPASHRVVKFEDPMEVAEVIQLANLLLRVVRRAAARPAADSH